MKTNWERSYKEITLDIETVSNLLRTFIREEEISELESVSGGLNNSNIKVITNLGNKYVLRLFSNNDGRAELEGAVLKELQETEVPVPHVLYEDYSLSQYDHPFILLSWMEGIQLSQSDHFPAESVGKILAEIHRITFDSAGMLDGKLGVKEPITINAASFMNFMNEMLIEGYAPSHIGEKEAKRIYNFAAEHASLLDDIGQQNSLVHSDFNPLNLLVDNNSEVTAVLDWEYAFSGTPLIDIGNLVRYEDVKTSDRIGSLIHSYQEYGGTLPSQWLKKAKLLDLTALCDLLNRPECGEVRLKDLKELIERTIRQWNTFDDIKK